MAIYEYTCDNNHIYTEQRAMTEPEQENRTCEICELSLRRIYGTPAIQFKGRGFNSSRG